MGERSTKLLPILVLAILCGGSIVVARNTPAYFSNPSYLGALLFLQLLVAALWTFRVTFFGFLMLGFVWAGVDVPMSEPWTMARWITLAVGALIGCVLVMQDRQRRFRVFHLVAFFCVMGAVASALVSGYPQTALLKAGSLLLLFLYGSSGGRLAIHGRETSFFPGLLLSCEFITYGTTVAYFVLGSKIWGNPNSLGAVMGVVVAPLLFWGILILPAPTVRWRRSFAFLLSMILLFYSFSRASIIAALFSMFLMCVVLRRQKLLAQGAILSLFLLAAFAIFGPRDVANFSASTSDLVYKGHHESGVLGSRKSPWQQTMSVISEHPWFGSGFGTSPSGKDQGGPGLYASNTEINREHGSSYLAILEWVGLIGIVPFVFLLILLLRQIGHALASLRNSPQPPYAAVPILLILIGGLVHAAFEDWLFAVGYYLTVFFWTFAFVLFDVCSVPERSTAASSISRPIVIQQPPLLAPAQSR